MAQQQSTKKKTIHEKLLEVQRDLKAPKNQFNKFGGYNYRSAEDIIEAVKPLLCEKGLVQTITDDIVQVGERYYVKATVTVTDGEDSIQVSGLAREEENKKGTDSMQLTGATSSYARKYAMNGMYAIDDNKDSDSTNKHGKDKSQENLRGAAKEAKQPQQSDDDLTDGKSQAAFQVALQKFKDCQSKKEISDNGRTIMAQARKEGLKEGDENKLKQEINQLYDTLPEKAADGKQESSGEQSTASSTEASG